jgi:hypothetical protein
MLGYGRSGAEQAESERCLAAHAQRHSNQSCENDNDTDKIVNIKNQNRHEGLKQ